MDITTFRARYEPLAILPTPGRSVLNTVKHATLFALRHFGRGMGTWRTIDLGTRFWTNWAECPVIGPDDEPMYVDLRGKGFGQITRGYLMAEFLPLIHVLDEAAVALDIGANIGVLTRLLAARVSHGRVFAFEPSPSTFALLHKNTAEIPNVTCVQVALADHSGAVRFRESVEPGLRHLSTGTPTTEPGTIEVRVSRLDDWVRDQQLGRLDLIKIDVEGLEEEVLMGAQEVIQAFRPTIVFEYIASMASQRSRYAGDKLFHMMRDAGYLVLRLDARGGLHHDFSKPEDWTNDYVALVPDGAMHAALRTTIG